MRVPFHPFRTERETLEVERGMLESELDLYTDDFYDYERDRRPVHASGHAAYRRIQDRLYEIRALLSRPETEPPPEP